jgi:hypothetical protein
MRDELKFLKRLFASAETIFAASANTQCAEENTVNSELSKHQRGPSNVTYDVIFAALHTMLSETKDRDVDRLRQTTGATNKLHSMHDGTPFQAPSEFQSSQNQMRRTFDGCCRR